VPLAKSKIPSNYKLIYDKQFVAERVLKTAKDISTWVDTSAENQILAVCILRGATFFFADLLREIPFSVEAAYCSAKSYSIETNKSEGELSFSLGSIDPKGRKILLVDEICDTGLTFERLSKELISAGAVEVRTVALINRELKSKDYSPDWTVVNHQGEEWFVGLGMDDKNTYTNLPDIYVVEP